MDNTVEKIKSEINESNNIVFLGGAGVSTESGIPDFRSSKSAMYTKEEYGYEAEEILSHTFLCNNPKLFYKYFRENLVHPQAEPNDAHKSLAKLEEMGKLKAVVTQNIDRLHQKAGSRSVLELHGSVFRNYCMECGKYFTLEYVLDNVNDVPYCQSCSGLVRPDVVLYGEPLRGKTIKHAVSYIADAEILIVGGTSLSVYPAAGLLNYYKNSKLILINKSSTVYDDRALLVSRESIGSVLSYVCEGK